MVGVRKAASWGGRRVNSGAKPSLRLDAGRLDDGPPLLDLGLMEGAQGLGRLLLAREYLLAKVGEPCAYA
jgi:hypothetical protein